MIEVFQSLPGDRQADDDGAVVDRRSVERVRGLAQLQHHVVGRVDHVADWSHAGCLEPHLDRVRGRAHLRAADPATDETGAEPRLSNFHLQVVANRPAGLLDRDLRPADRGARGRGDFAGQADET